MSLEQDLQTALLEIKRLNKLVHHYRQILKANNLLPAEESADKPQSCETDKQLVIEKRLRIYQTLFRGRTDVYARKWTSGEKKGYAPVTSSDGCYNILTRDVLFRHLSAHAGRNLPLPGLRL